MIQAAACDISFVHSYPCFHFINGADIGELQCMVVSHFSRYPGGAAICGAGKIQYKLAAVYTTPYVKTHSPCGVFVWKRHFIKAKRVISKTGILLHPLCTGSKNQENC